MVQFHRVLRGALWLLQPTDRVSVRSHVHVLRKLLRGLLHHLPQKESVQKQKCVISPTMRVEVAVVLPCINNCLPPVSRGDTFSEAEDVSEASTTPAAPTVDTLAAATPTPPLSPIASDPTFPPVDADAAPCSGRPFDAFLQLKNTSIYAFRGECGQWNSGRKVKSGLRRLIKTDCFSTKGNIFSSWMTSLSSPVIPN